MAEIDVVEVVEDRLQVFGIAGPDGPTCPVAWIAIRFNAGQCRRRVSVDMVDLDSLLEHAINVRKRSIPVQVRFAIEDGLCETLEGIVHVRATDAILTGSQGERWPVSAEYLRENYIPLGNTVMGQDGTYLKTLTDARAVRLTAPTVITIGTTRDSVEGEPGDWLLKYSDGTWGIIQDSVFNRTYEKEK